MAGDTGILCHIEAYGSGQETDRSMTGQPSDSGVPQERSNSAVCQNFTIYGMTLKKDN